RHTRCLSDWSSDVCSSDLTEPLVPCRRTAIARAWPGWMQQQRAGIGNGHDRVQRMREVGRHGGRVQVLEGRDANVRLQHRKLIEIGRASCRESVWITLYVG